ncbi:MAG: ribonuclease H-like domain-containing protein [Desulfosarcina sp.]|nr:ribonuclease H-like domain-containing protein [Desulfosarcina sp.]MBC2743292.1 ribonuclease H-like domain-containing protein [Desulfosarcina sp.]MBC2766202.1 ribonuclease H-like domain-containing protein [Desulfosarcina sp.]
MLRHTFLHIPGIGPKTEAGFWAGGVDDWNAFFDDASLKLSKTKREAITDVLKESRRQLDLRNPGFFAHHLPANQHWRLFPEFRSRTAYLDIETTGLDEDCTISTIAVYDGSTMATYVQGRNLDDFIDDIYHYKVLVTYNGKCFDVPVIERTFGRCLDHAHIDLRYVLASLGLKGGLKRCEAQLGMNRGEMEEIDGLFAVVLWKAYLRNRDDQALETLLAYNLQDAINLESLMVTAFNLKIRQTPFDRRYRLPLPKAPENPIPVHRHTIDRYRSEAAFIRSIQPQW